MASKGKNSRAKRGAVNGLLVTAALAAVVGGCTPGNIEVRAGGAKLRDPVIKADERDVLPSIGARYNKGYFNTTVDYFKTELDDGFANVETDHLAISAGIGTNRDRRFYGNIGAAVWRADGSIKIPQVGVDERHTTDTWGSFVEAGVNIGKGFSIRGSYFHLPNSKNEKGILAFGLSYKPSYKPRKSKVGNNSRAKLAKNRRIRWKNLQR